MRSRFAAAPAPVMHRCRRLRVCCSAAEPEAVGGLEVSAEDMLRPREEAANTEVEPIVESSVGDELQKLSPVVVGLAPGDEQEPGYHLPKYQAHIQTAHAQIHDQPSTLSAALFGAGVALALSWLWRTSMSEDEIDDDDLYNYDNTTQAGGYEFVGPDEANRDRDALLLLASGTSNSSSPFLRDPRQLQAIMNNQIGLGDTKFQAPESSAESVQWVNMVIRKIWKIYQRPLERWLVRTLQRPIDAVKKPEYVKRVVISRLSFGDEPILFRNMKRRPSRQANDLQYQADVRYTGNIQVLLTVELGNAQRKLVDVPVQLFDLDLEAELWTKLRLSPAAPFIDTISLAFVRRPMIRFELAPFRQVRLMTIPFLNTFLRKLLMVDLPDRYVHPRRIDFALRPDVAAVAAAAVAKASDAGEDGPACSIAPVNTSFEGELSVQLVEARRLPVWGPSQGVSDPYCVLTIGTQRVESKRDKATSTQLRRRRGYCVWAQEFVMLVEDAARQRLVVQVNDSPVTLRPFIGLCQFSISQLSEGTPVDIWLPLESGGRPNGGQVRLKLTYKRYVDNVDLQPLSLFEREYSEQLSPTAGELGAITPARMEPLDVVAELVQPQMKALSERQFPSIPKLSESLKSIGIRQRERAEQELWSGEWIIGSPAWRARQKRKDQQALEEQLRAEAMAVRQQEQTEAMEQAMEVLEDKENEEEQAIMKRLEELAVRQQQQAMDGQESFEDSGWGGNVSGNGSEGAQSLTVQESAVMFDGSQWQPGTVSEYSEPALNGKREAVNSLEKAGHAALAKDLASSQGHYSRHQQSSGGTHGNSYAGTAPGGMPTRLPETGGAVPSEEDVPRKKSVKELVLREPQELFGLLDSRANELVPSYRWAVAAWVVLVLGSVFGTVAIADALQVMHARLQNFDPAEIPAWLSEISLLIGETLIRTEGGDKLL